MKQTQKVAEKQGMLGYIIEQITPFLEKYPQTTNSMANIFLAVLKARHQSEQLLPVTLQSIERLKIEVGLTIKGKNAKVQKALLEFMICDVMNAALGLGEIKNELELEEVRQFFEGLRIKTANFEAFLRKELNVSDSTTQSNSLFSSMLDIQRAGMGREDFTLRASIEIPVLKDAIQKYFEGLGGSVTFNEKYDTCSFRYKLPSISGYCTVTHVSSSIMVTLC